MDESSDMNEYIRNNIFIKSEGVDNTDDVDGLDGTEPTNAHGTVIFKGSTRRSKAKFVRLSDETKPEILYKLLTTYWGLPEPRILVSVTGGAKNLFLSPKMKKMFALGLLKVAKTPGAWVITGGTNTGIMEHVGVALQGATKACIGIATWGILKNNEHLEQNQNRDLGGDFDYEVDNSMTEEFLSYLDPNHTHFLLVDDGTRIYGKEVDFRNAFEKEIMKTADIPSVVLMVEGGVGTIGTVKGALNGSPPMAVVVIKGSGRAADVLAYAYDHLETSQDLEEARYNTNHVVYKYLEKSHVVIRENEMSDEDFKTKLLETYENVLCCLKKRSLITVFQLDSGNAVDEAMLQALLTSLQQRQFTDEREKSERLFSQLKLTIIWDRPYLAQKILKDSAGVLERCYYERAMVMSLAWNRVQIVQIFIDYGVSVHKCLTDQVLEGLYNFAANQKDSVLKVALGKRRPGTGLINDERRLDDLELKSFGKYRDIVRELVKKLCQDLMLQDEELLEEDIKDPFKELFYWAVLNNMPDMALYMWQFGDGAMEKALIAAEMYKQLVEKFGGTSLLSDDVINSLSEACSKFKDHAVSLLDECWKTKEDLTYHLIDYPSSQFIPPKHEYSKQTRLKLAVETCHKGFISHNAIQNLLNKLWTMPLQSTNFCFLSIIFTIIFPLWVKKLDFQPPSQVKKMVNISDDPDIDKIDELSDDENSKLQERDSKKRQTRNYGSIQTNKSNRRWHNDEWTLCQRICHFYSMPMVRFYTHVIMYLIFSVLLTYIVLLDKNDHKPEVLEYCLLTYVLTYTAEEIRQIYYGAAKGCWTKLKLWWKSWWNTIDLALILTFFLAFALRFHHTTTGAAELIYALNAGGWILRLLHIFHAHPIIGPYVFMIHRMFVDMMYFLAILVVFMIAYGVANNAILHRRHNVFTMLRDISFHPYFNIYGELFIDRDRTDNVTTRFGTPIYNSYDEPVAWALFSCYLLVANVLLLNLLIAVFGDTFAEVKENSSQIWKYERYGLFMEYTKKSVAPPPFNIFYMVYKVWKLTRTDDDKGRKKTLEKKRAQIKEELLNFEVNCVAELLRKQTADDERMDEILETSNDTSMALNRLEGKVEDWKKDMESKLNDLFAEVKALRNKDDL